MIVRACNLRVGDVAHHPESYQLAQVGELRCYPALVLVVTLDGCWWRLEPDALLEVLHRVVEVES